VSIVPAGLSGVSSMLLTFQPFLFRVEPLIEFGNIGSQFLATLDQ
jgi:hypothetical protein